MKIKGTFFMRYILFVLTVGTYSLGNSFWVYVINRHVFPTIPSPTHVIFKGLKLPFVAILETLCVCVFFHNCPIP